MASGVQTSPDMLIVSPAPSTARADRPIAPAPRAKRIPSVHLRASPVAAPALKGEAQAENSCRLFRALRWPAQLANCAVVGDAHQMCRRNPPTLTGSASGSENSGRHTLEVFHPPTSRRRVAIRVSTMRASGNVGIPPIRGRARELEVIGALITAVAQGRGGVLVIEGPPGIGKSRLLTEVLALAEKAGVRALFGEAFEYQQTVPFFSLFMATLRADPPVGDAEALRRLGTSADLRYWVVRDLQAAIHAAASRIPLAILLEDIHWADNATLLALRSLAARGPMPRCCGCLPREPAPAGRPLQRDADRAGTRGCQVSAVDGHDTGRGRRHGARRRAGQRGCVAAESGRQGARKPVPANGAAARTGRGGSARSLRRPRGRHRRHVAATARRHHAATTRPALRQLRAKSCGWPRCCLTGSRPGCSPRCWNAGRPSWYRRWKRRSAPTYSSKTVIR